MTEYSDLTSLLLVGNISKKHMFEVLRLRSVMEVIVGSLIPVREF